MDLPSPNPTCVVEPNTESICHSLYQTWRDLDSVRKRIKLIKEEIEKANLSLEELQETEKDLLGIAAAKASFLSPFQHLPRDIFDEIAGNCVSIDNDIARMDRGVWPLTHVCRAWRNSVLSLPSLWSSFSIDCSSLPPCDLVKTVLKRSQHHPLSFSATATGARSEYTSQVMLLLANHCERWKRVHLQGTFPPTPFLGIYRRLPHLEHLKLELEQSDVIENRWLNTPSHRTIFKEAPKLTSLVLTVHMVSFDNYFEFPLRQLSDLSCCNALLWIHRQGQWTPLNLCACNNLIRLHLNSEDWGVLPEWEKTNRVNLPVLTHLIIEQTTALLCLLRLTSNTLKTLELRKADTSGRGLNDVRMFFDANPDQELTTFGFCGEEDRDDGLKIEGLLSHRAFHSLHTLTLELGELDDYDSWITSLLSRLTYRPQNTVNPSMPPIHLSRLRNFTLKFEYGMPVEVDILYLLDPTREFIASRTSQVEANLDGTSDHTLSCGKDPEDSLKPAPVRLENVCIGISNYEPITLTTFNCLAAKIRDVQDMLDCGCQSLLNEIYSHVHFCKKRLSDSATDGR